MNKRMLFFIAFLLATLATIGYGDPTTDPLRHFRSTAILSSDAEILSITADLNGDGTDDWLISATDEAFDDGKGKLWRAYVSTAEGKFISRSKPTMLPADMIAKTLDRDTGEPILVSYQPDGIEHGVITRLSYVGGALSVDPLKRVEPMGADEDFVKSLFAPSNLLKPISHSLESIEALPGAELEATGLQKVRTHTPSDSLRLRLTKSRDEISNHDKVQESTSSVLIPSLAWIAVALILLGASILLFKRFATE